MIEGIEPIDYDSESEVFSHEPFGSQFTPSFVNPHNVPIVGKGKKLSITDQHGTRTYDCDANGKPIGFEDSAPQYQGLNSLDMKLNSELMDQHDPRFRYK